MTTEQRIEQLQRRWLLEKEYLPFKVSVSLKADYQTRKESYNLIFPNVMEKMTKKEVADFLLTYPAVEDQEINITGEAYNVRYKLDLSSNPHGSALSVKYVDPLGNMIYLTVPVEWVKDFISYHLVLLPENQLHYYPGVARGRMPLLKKATFKSAKVVNYFGGGVGLCDNDFANEIIQHLLTFGS